MQNRRASARQNKPEAQARVDAGGPIIQASFSDGVGISTKASAPLAPNGASER